MNHLQKNISTDQPLKPLHIEASTRFGIREGQEVRYWVGRRVGRGRIGRITQEKPLFIAGHGKGFQVDNHDEPIPAKNMKLHFSTPPTSEELPLGTKVRYWSMGRDDVPKVSTVRTPVFMVCGTPVVSVEGKAGGIALTHIEVVTEDESVEA